MPNSNGAQQNKTCLVMNKYKQYIFAIYVTSFYIVDLFSIDINNDFLYVIV